MLRDGDFFDAFHRIPMAHKNRIGGFHDNEVVHPAEGHCAALGYDDVVRRSEFDDTPLKCVVLVIFSEVVGQGRLGTDIIPVELRF